nr:cholinephosphotransferase 1 isoform X6 [Manis javanica]
MAAGAGARPTPRWLKALAEPLSAAQLRRLEEHRYSAAGVSLLEPPLQLCWTWLLQWVPLWMAPNSITLLGLAVNLLTTLVLISYCPTATEEAPYWTYLFCALGLFIYQSLDAIDGKQARRTNSCSPLGELFDHGCDSLSTVFMATGASIAIRLGTHPDWLFFCSFVGMFMFYCAHWQTYVSGVLRFGKVDVTEIQIALVIIFLLSTFGGATMWDYTIAHMTKSELYLQDTVFFGPGLLFLDQYFNNFIDEYVVLWIAMVISSFDMIMYFSTLCLQISRHLHLKIFKTSCHEAPEKVQVVPSKSHQNNMD